MRIPVIRGKIGEWIYYSGVMSFSQIAKKVVPSIGDLYKTSCLGELLQRALTDNYENIKDYILKDSERFFNAIILAIYDGNPQWLEVEFNEEDGDYNNVGFLDFSGGETIFPVDGQHRVAGIIAALKQNPELEFEQVPVIFIAHSNTDAGMKKTRKLFSTLNRRAKPVGQNENIALDEDDVCSIITRELLQECPLCMGNNIVNSLGKQIPNSNEIAFTSLITLYQCVEVLVKSKLEEQGIKGKKYNEYKLYRPKDDALLAIKDFVISVFKDFSDNTDSIKEYVASTDDRKASMFRNASGGSLLFRPIALTEYFEAATILFKRGVAENYADIFKQLNEIEMNISHQPWVGLVWDGTKIINRASKTVIRMLLVSMVNASILTDKEKDKLNKDYASSLNLSLDSAAKLIEAASVMTNT